MNQPPHPARHSPAQPSDTASVAGFTSHPGVTAQCIGERLRRARIAANKTQQELVGDTYSKSYLSAVERGKMMPSFQALGVLAERLCVPISYLLGEVDPPANPEAAISSPSTLEAEAREEHLRLRREAEELLQRGHDEEAALFLQRHAEVAQQSGDARTRGVVLAALVRLHTARGEYTQALTTAREALEVAQAHADYATVGQVQLTLATASAVIQNETAAEQAFQSALTAFEQAGQSDWLSYTHEQYGHFLAARQRYQDAYEQLRLAGDMPNARKTPAFPPPAAP
jgi:transcriptional regulator with XRE-family HTH domain